MSETRQLKVVIAGDAKSARAAVKVLSQGLDEVEGKAQRSGNVWGNFGSKLATVGKLAATGLGVAAGAIGTLGITTAANFEQLEVSFGTLLKSNGKAKTEMAWLKDKAAATPFELSDLANADRTLLGFGFKVDETRKNFLMSMGDMAAAVGLPSARLPDLTRIFGQVHAAGAVSMEDINQLIDAGVPIWDMLTAATGKSVKTIREEIEARKLSADTFEKATQTYTKNNFAGAMDKQSQTLTGLWSSLKDNVSIAAAEMVKPLIPLVKEWMPKFADAAKSAGEFVTNDLIPALKGAWDWYKKNEDVINTLAIVIGTAIVVWKAYIFVTVTIPAALKALRIGILAVNAAMRANPVGVIITLLLALAVGIAYLWTHNEKFRKIVIAVWNAIKGAVMAVVNWFKEEVPAAWSWVKDKTLSIFNGVKDFFAEWGLTILAVITGPIGWIVGLVIKHWDDIKNFTVAAWNGLKDAVTTVVDFVVSFVVGYFTNLYNFWRWVWDGISSAVSAVWNWIKDTIAKGIVFAYTTVTNGLDKVKSVWSSVWGWVSGHVSGAWNGIKNAVSGGINGMLDFVRGIPGRIKDAIGNLGGLLWNAGKSAIQGLLDGIESMIGKVKDKLKSVTRLIPDWKGPLNTDKVLLKPAGMAIMGSLVDGFDKGIPEVKGSLHKLTADISATGSSGLAGSSLAGASGGQVVNVNVIVQGSVTAERDLAKSIALKVRDEIARNGKRNGGKTGL